MGESSRAQAEAARDAAVHEQAVDVDAEAEPDSEDEDVMGGEGVRGQLDLSSQVSLDLSQSQDA